MATTLSLDRYAELQADVEAGRPRDEVLDRAGLSVEEWTAAQRQWLDTVGSELVLGGFELANRYTRVFLARQRFLAKPAASVAVVAASAALPDVAAPPDDAAPVAVEATPSYLAVAASPPAPAAVKRAPAALAGTSMGFVAPRGPALPFAASVAPSPAVTAPVAAVVPVVPPTTAAAVKRAPAALAGTSMGFVAPIGPALPFARGAPADAAEGPKLVPMPNDPLPGARIATTGGPPGEVRSVSAPPLPASAHAGEVVPLPADPTATPALPAAPPPLTLQQYASLCAELAVIPERSEATFQQYGLGKMRDRLTVDLSWQERLRRNPAEQQGWQALYRRWVAHFQEMKPESEGY